MLSRMEAGKFKVFAELNDWFEEFRLYRRKDGRVVKERDDYERHAICGHDVAVCRRARSAKACACCREAR